MFRQYSPPVETWILALRPVPKLGPIPAGDKYFLGKWNSKMDPWDHELTLPKAKRANMVAEREKDAVRACARGRLSHP